MTVRTGMQTLIDTVRGYANAGTAEWTVETESSYISYWSDVEIQRVLDRHRIDIVHQDMQPILSYSGGSVIYLTYDLGYGNVESGTAVFKIEDVSGTIGGWTMDYARGIATFSSNTSGSTYYWTGNTYDLYGAAADIWRMKAANVARMVNFSTDGHSINRGDLRKSYLEMADYFAGMSPFGAAYSVKMTRDDV